MPTTTKKACQREIICRPDRSPGRSGRPQAGRRRVQDQGGHRPARHGQGQPQKGEVIAVGEGYIRDDGSRVPLTVKEGDDVIFNSYGGEEIKIGDEEYLLLRESDILATF